MQIPVSVVVDTLKELLTMNSALVCRHYIAGGLLSRLEAAGVNISDELAKAVVCAEDETALVLLSELNL